MIMIMMMDDDDNDDDHVVELVVSPYRLISGNVPPPMPVPVAV